MSNFLFALSKVMMTFGDYFQTLAQTLLALPSHSFSA